VERFSDDLPDDELVAHGHDGLPRLRSGHGGQELNAPFILLCSNPSIVTWIFFIVFPCGLLSFLGVLV
jgi:hypothetical protein